MGDYGNYGQQHQQQETDPSNPYLAPNAPNPYTGSMFVPDPSPGPQDYKAVHGPPEWEDEPPLLEELGIHPDHILQKTLNVLNPMMTTEAAIAGDSDLAGPIVFALAFGSFIMFSGKLYFNYIYGIGLLGHVRPPQPDVPFGCLLCLRRLCSGLLPSPPRWPFWYQRPLLPLRPRWQRGGGHGNLLVHCQRQQALCHCSGDEAAATIGGIPVLSALWSFCPYNHVLTQSCSSRWTWQ